jgi:hypothetical protein
MKPPASALSCHLESKVLLYRNSLLFITLSIYCPGARSTAAQLATRIARWR